MPAAGRAETIVSHSTDTDRNAAVAPQRSDIEVALESVLDPELGMSVISLGLVYGVHIAGGTVRITMTLTARGCPLHEVMTDWVRTAVSRVIGVDRVEVIVTFDPPWTPDRIRAATPQRRSTADGRRSRTAT
jgi:metal-sulfur cluster biosynthetic enzyme